jgi:hypothetical protein
MKNKINVATKFAVLITLSIQANLAHANGMFSITSGLDYSTGKYGQSKSTDITYVPFTAKYETDLTTLKLTVPWLSITGPGDVVGADAAIVKQGSSGKTTTESGLGDVVFSATQTIANIGETHPLILDLTGKVKFATASTSKGLGTGKNDYSIALDAYKPLTHALTLFSGLGYKKLGDPTDVNLNNVWFCSAGLSYKINPSSSAGIMADYRQATLNTSYPLREVTAFFTHKFSAPYKLQTYLTHGYSDASTDWGGGVMLGWTF